MAKSKKKESKKILRDRSGHILPGSGPVNPDGKRKKPPTSREARVNLPIVIERIIKSACKDSKWLEVLKHENPLQFSSTMVALARYAEKDEPPPPAEDSMTNQEAMAIINQIKADALAGCECKRKG